MIQTQLTDSYLLKIMLRDQRKSDKVTTLRCYAHLIIRRLTKNFVRRGTFNGFLMWRCTI